MPMISVSLMSSTLLTLSIYVISDRCEVITPLGLPVEPDVKMTYSGEVQVRVAALAESSSSSAGVSMICSMTMISPSKSSSLAASR